MKNSTKAPRSRIDSPSLSSSSPAHAKCSESTRRAARGRARFARHRSAAEKCTLRSPNQKRDPSISQPRRRALNPVDRRGVYTGRGRTPAETLPIERRAKLKSPEACGLAIATGRSIGDEQQRADRFISRGQRISRDFSPAAPMTEDGRTEPAERERGFIISRPAIAARTRASNGPGTMAIVARYCIPRYC